MSNARPSKSKKIAEEKSDSPSKLLFNDTLEIPKLTDTIESIIRKSEFAGGTPEEHADHIVEKFNLGMTNSAVTTTIMPGRGQRFEPNQFILASRNGKPELVKFNNLKVAAAITNVGSTTEIVKTVNISDKFYGQNGRYVLNVQQGQFAKGFTGSGTPILFGEGTHVVADPTFRLANAEPKQLDSNFVSQADHYINHGTIHILRIPAGNYAKIWIANQPYLLPSRPEAYVFQNPLFSLEAPDAKKGVYYVSATEAYILHGTIKLLRVPAGSLAKVWDGSVPYLLEARPQPYITSSPTFLFYENYLVKTTEKLITHGSITRVMPETGEVAIAYDSGTLEVYPPSEDGQPIIHNSPTFRVDGFLATKLQTIAFPSQKMIAKRKSENPKASPDELNNEIVKSQDGLSFAVKLLVTFAIEKPELAMRELGGEDAILEHIENVATVDMSRVIQTLSSQEFLSFEHTTAAKAKTAESKDVDFMSGVPAKPLPLQERVKTELAKDLERYGIRLDRLNFETPKILDPEIQRQMSEQAVLSTTTAAKVANIDKQTELLTKEANREAAINKVKQTQINVVTVSLAQAKADAAKLEAEAIKTKAQGDADAAFIAVSKQAEGLTITATAQKESQAKIGELYREHPELLQLELAKIQAEALSRATILVAPAEINNLFSARAALGFFPSLGGTTAVQPQLASDKGVLTLTQAEESKEQRVVHSVSMAPR
jgi:hypothetical protein